MAVVMQPPSVSADSDQHYQYLGNGNGGIRIGSKITLRNESSCLVLANDGEYQRIWKN